MTLPLSAIWLDAAGVGEMLSCSDRQVRERLACRPDFPKAHKEKGLGLRWNAAEVDAWFRMRRELTGGRPRDGKYPEAFYDPGLAPWPHPDG